MATIGVPTPAMMGLARTMTIMARIVIRNPARTTTADAEMLSASAFFARRFIG